MKKLSSIFIPIVFMAASWGCSKSPETYTLTINNNELKVEIAVTHEEKQRGLMHRENLAENEGMLFVYEEDRVMSFWMKNTTIPLSIAFLSKEGEIIDIKNLTPRSERSVQSSRSVRYALEVNQGFFSRHGIQEGDRVNFSKELEELIGP
ncbi:MAG: DUF192 domain-containing protein [Spirochaetia bacterium]